MIIVRKTSGDVFFLTYFTNLNRLTEQSLTELRKIKKRIQTCLWLCFDSKLSIDTDHDTVATKDINLQPQKFAALSDETSINDTLNLDITVTMLPHVSGGFGPPPQ